MPLGNCYTPNANMADHSVGAWDELRVFCFDNAFVQKSYLFVNLVSLFSLCLRVAMFLNAKRSDRSVHHLPLREKVDRCNLSRQKKRIQYKEVHDRCGNSSQAPTEWSAIFAFGVLK